MELVGKVVRKEIDGVGFCSGTVRSYDPSGYYEIVYENGVTETSRLAEFTAALATGEEEGKSEETQAQVYHRERNVVKRPRDEVNVMRNVDLNDAVPEDSEGLRGNVVDLNCGTVETLAFDLNRAVPEPDEGLGYEEGSSNKRRRLIDLNMDAEVCDLNADEREAGWFDLNANEREEGLFDLNADEREEGWFDLNVAAVDVENSKDDELIQMNGDGQVQETNVQDENGVQDHLETGGCEEVHVAEVSSGQSFEELREEQNSVSLPDLNAPDSNGVEGDHDLPELDADKTVDKSLSDTETLLRRSSRGVLAPIPASSTVTACLADEVSSGQSLEELREQNSVSLLDLNAPDSNGAEGDHDLPELDSNKTVDKSLSDTEIPDENTRLRRSSRGVLAPIPTSSTVTACLADEVSSGQSLEELQEQNSVSLLDLNAPDSNGAEGDHDLPELDANKTVDESLSDTEIPDENTRLRRSSRGVLAPIPASSTVTACLADEVSSGQSLEELREQNSVTLLDLNAPDSNGAEGDHDLPELDSNKTVDKSLSDREILDENTRLRRSSRGVLAPIPASSTVTACLADEVSSGQSLEELREQNSVTLLDLNAPDSNGAEGDHDLPELDSNKTVDKSLSDREIPDENTRLRRSARGVLAPIPASSTVTACLADEVSPSPSVNSLTAEENGIVDGEAEDISVLPPKPQLPPSSPILNLDGLPILYVFATYSLLRSFSTVLFLSPFELKDFVEALRCTSPCLLFDSIHVSVLQLLRKVLEKLAGEDDQSATLCLRSLDWDMLDVVNYPLFVVEYMLYAGSKDSPRVDLTRFKFFRNEYFRLPMNLKIQILTCLCGDMIAAEVVRSELNKRSVAADSEMDTNRKTNSRKRAMMELANDFSSNDGVVDGSFDRNIADCCICKMDGNLLCCGGCPAAYHSKCVGVACDLLPEGVWYCPECSFDRPGPGWKREMQIQGWEFIEIDPHGREYYSSCGYLLVIDTGSVNYYHANDVNLVLEQLKSYGSFYIGVTSAIEKHWNIPVKAPPEKQATSGVKKRLEETSSNGGSHLRCHRTRGKISGAITGPDIQNMCAEGSSETAHNGLDIQSLHETESSSILDVLKEPNMMNTRREVRPNGQSKSGYRNQYIFAQMTTAISEEMARNSPDRSNDMRFDEEIASTQVKTILMKTTKFQWRNIQCLYLDAWKEKCGWCHSCKSKDTGGEKNCLFNMSLGALRGPSESEISNSQPINNKSHLVAIIWQLLSMESRLQGLLVGPWLNPKYSSIWREHVLKASSISSLRHLLVELEANLHHLVLSPQWLNHVDSAVEMGSSTHVLLASTRSSSEITTGKRRGTLLESATSWWRGGRLSRKLFNWKVLPRSLVSKAAIQGGSVNIPGIMYPENSEPAKRSRRVAWEAAVESSTTSEQLGFQVRTLNSYIKWDDIEDSHLLLASDKESQKSARLFKKVIVRSKCIEEETVKYLLDFGKKRSICQSRYIPDVVLKNGRMIEESSGEKRQYWLNESYVPLHLLKEFERKAVRNTGRPGRPSRHPEIDRVRKRSSKGKGLSYLFKRAERTESSLCEQCKEDVPLSDAACCHICKRLFHKKHIRRADEEGMYICLPCKSEVLDEQPILLKRARPPGSLRNKIGAQTQKRETIIPARNSPLRRSGRKTNQVIRLQDELEYERGGDRPKKARRENSIGDKKDERFTIYWLNGLCLSRNPGDKRIDKFWRHGCSKPLKNSGSDKVQRKCRLCGSIDSESGSILIACETCKKWYHGDACGINDENSSMVIGFRCHFCRELTPPSCPHM
ncbi:DDT domain-containing protein PTM [Raphanus sativus]|uniref:DDT domain-containing protein PTM n=1 Tax=Raphanus sativus TaxID=3726 RepID=A0A6J0KGG7_RAPSA|nr:DDT domain-containing protein PTM [Raphanus sativus]